VFILNLETLHR